MVLFVDFVRHRLIDLSRSIIEDPRVLDIGFILVYDTAMCITHDPVLGNELMKVRSQMKSLTE